ncbi:MAG: leucine-rich repeat protein [Bacteroidales bacterium]|nr:leucine-rich repeat protein [Bacteroidales bacterium]
MLIFIRNNHTYSVTTIGQFAFAATGIIDFTFPNKIETIVSHSVYNCPKLESITIPSSVTTIEYSAFFANNALKTVRIYATKPPTITNGSAIFNGDVHTTCVLEVPKGYTTTYYNATGWAFSYITEIQ